MPKALGAFYLSAYALLTYHLYVYAFDNPDPEALYAEVNKKPGMFTAMDLDSMTPNYSKVENMDDVHGKFLSWFRMGFC